MAPSLIFTIIFVLSVSRPENRAHGLDHESPIVLSPEMYEYLHPKPHQASTNNLCGSSECYSLPLAAANVQPNRAHERGAAGIPLVLIFGCLIMLAVGYVMIKRHSNAQRARVQQQPDV